MPMPRRNQAWIWTGRILAALVLAALAAYLVTSGLDKADKVSSAISLLIALAALLAPYLLPTRAPSQPQSPHLPQPQPPQSVEQAGNGVTNVSRSQGVQINQQGGGTQNNTFGGPS
ncbi:hypothetical protein J7F03_27840 [Streptomyces sp. ISL-43]|uniref:hypothetical protein n=1 Tax=Streptomyces sp. ISL-43 TaxID=2819183 RepID=UPI001BEB2200|nr:hypothetical protein [Streptomyces sp. ISL-43]MBT2450817.1 hypothetical protein [Streptomyces sp. ISL-43]